MTKKKSLEWLNCSESELESRIQDWVRSSGRTSSSVDWCDTILFLEGELGAGKSTFARFFLKSLGVTESSRGSPTFPIIHSYALPDYSAYHMDLYRLKSDAEIEAAGVESAIEQPRSVVLIEWSELFPDYFQYWKNSNSLRSKIVWIVEIEFLAENKRTIRLSRAI